MRLLFKQRLFSWFHSYDIYNDRGETVYTVKGELAWGHLLRIYDVRGNAVGCIKEKLFSFLPEFHMFIGDEHIGRICKQFTFFKPRFDIDCNGWTVEGDWFEWNYAIRDPYNKPVAQVSKELWNFTDTYVIDVVDPRDALCALMLVLAIDADKCSRNN